ncbi:TPA: hypothetical protein HA241_05560 [Candidatus Woesearchaeota archaeon]|nr:hypothetical protein [Candidatus Woesearchaeota archaeon]
MKNLEQITKRVVLGTMLAAVITTTGINVCGYRNTKRELELEIQNDPLVLTSMISESVVGERIAERQLRELDNAGFNLFSFGRRYALREYLDWCKESDNVGVI